MRRFKQTAITVLSIAAYWLCIDSLFYWLNRKAKRTLTFHNVIPDALWTPIANGVSCTESDFLKIVREVSHRFNFSVDLFDTSTVTITFDDGYLNQYEVAGRNLMRMGIPAILFIAGGNLNSANYKNALVVDQLLLWVGHVPLNIVDSENKQAIWVRELRPKFASDSGTKGLRCLQEVNMKYPMELIWAKQTKEYLRLRLTGISASEIETLRRYGWQVGWHTKSHFPLSSLSDADIRKEMRPPEEFKNIVFSYPFGELQSVDERCLKIAEECGYPCAVSNLTDKNKLTGRYFLPRMTLSSNKYRLHMRLSGLEHFIKTGKLLPVI